MRPNTPSSTSRRTRRLVADRARRRPLLLGAGLAVGILATTAVSATVPVAHAAEPQGPTYAFASFAAVDFPATPRATQTVATEARAAVKDAEATIAAASDVAADIETADLEVGAETSVDTAALQDGLARLQSGIAVMSPVLLPSLTGDISALTTAAAEKVATLRAALDAAVAKKKAEEAAAEKARLQAAAAPMFASGPVSEANSPAGAQAAARAMLGNYGWGDDQFGCLVSLWNKESGWNYRAYNASSGATGIPQALPGGKMASAGADWQTNAATQVRWGLGYIAGRYGSPCNAWAHSQSVGWY